METKKASINRTEANTYLILEAGVSSLSIVLTDDNPNNVKTVFNSLLKELKKGLFQFKLEDEIQDLYHHICTEYIVQLNLEIKTIYQELVDYELVDEVEGKET
jgi:hypothetical protein